MTKFKDFGSGTAQDEKEEISFKIYDEQFSCRPDMPGKVLLNLIAKTGGENPADSAQMIDDFFKAVLMPESYERFDALTQDTERVVSMETIGEITGWLVEAYSDRPTKRPEVSPNGA